MIFTNSFNALVYRLAVFAVLAAFATGTA